MSGPLVNNFEVPSWAGKPAPGLHLDVMKDGKLIQKLMVDEKKCYFFGRNKQMCDFCIDHASCSRVHAALVWHRHLSRPFLIDLGSTHGTYIGHIRLESRKPQQIPIDSELHFGASTRIYTIRERPQNIGQGDEPEKQGEKDGNLLGLPENETELDNLTEFNTAHNRRAMPLTENKDVKNPLKRKHKGVHISFSEEDDIINPEDVDPSIGKFRNLISTHVIATKRPKIEHGLQQGSMTDNITKRLQSFSYSHSLYDNVPGSGLTAASSFSMAAKLGVPLPNLAPDVNEEIVVPQINPLPSVTMTAEDISKEPKKKKYAKEAWPGKKPTHSFLV
ncbi:nuclear inhibitor of protein phosphatase 1-like [Ruditapes philippinarum]|uniref:nuclear inhibitor of protein phosphatase 1-like n=1 Tax=Ruditapes philippinarum TaxID=129788 RepID=UPI00295C2C09|nr:nuclear inhibitor of protein phosphatase 1-like [Ruditapes philippinarum]